MTRIIAGEARGRRLMVPPAGTRPTSDRAREGLFSSLGVRFGFSGQRVLDLYAGSGALGLEAASRGAAEITLVDDNRAAVKIIEANAAVVGHPEITIHQMRVDSFITTAPRQHYTMVLADPPYDFAAVEELLQALIPILAHGAAVVIERHRDSPETLWPAGFEPTTQKLKKRIYGIARMDMAVFHREEA